MTGSDWDINGVNSYRSFLVTPDLKEFSEGLPTGPIPGEGRRGLGTGDETVGGTSTTYGSYTRSGGRQDSPPSRGRGGPQDLRPRGVIEGPHGPGDSFRSDSYLSDLTVDTRADYPSNR